MNIQRLETLYHMLTSDIPPEVDFFNMGGWHVKNIHKEHLSSVSVSLTGTECGTAACALGCAALYPPFQKEGLVIFGSEVQYESRYGYDAASGFFKISKAHAQYLFSPTSYPVGRPITPLMVAARARELLDEECRK